MYRVSNYLLLAMLVLCIISIHTFTTSIHRCSTIPKFTTKWTKLLMEIEPTSSYSTADTNSGLVQTHIISSKQEIEQQALLLVQNYNVTIKSAKWVADRCEMILDSTEENVFLNAELLGKLHTELYETLSKESRFAELLETTEILLSTPGIGEYVKTNQDFISFKGFPVTVELHEPMKGSKEVKGSLMGRDDSFVRLSMKGRIVKIPHSNVAVIRLPKAKYEVNDYEIRKLQ